MYIIAEIGINHNGNMVQAKELISAAKTCGADACKFQLYDPLKVFPEPGPLQEEALRCQLSKDNWLELVEHAGAIDMPISASVFDTERLEWLAETDPPWYKVASRTFRNGVMTGMILRMAQEQGKKAYVSLGLYENTVSGAARIRRYASYENAWWLQCVSRYPAVIESKDIELMRVLVGDVGHGRTEAFYGRFVGFSDHTVGIAAALWAVAHGAKVIEKHFTLDKKMEGSDHACSADPGDLMLLRTLADEIAKIAAL